MAIVLEAVAQLLIYKQVHPGAALVLGPVLISVPHAVARALSNRWRRLHGATAVKVNGSGGLRPACEHALITQGHISI